MRVVTAIWSVLVLLSCVAAMLLAAHADPKDSQTKIDTVIKGIVKR